MLILIPYPQTIRKHRAAMAGMVSLVEAMAATPSRLMPAMAAQPTAAEIREVEALLPTVAEEALDRLALTAMGATPPRGGAVTVRRASMAVTPTRVAVAAMVVEQVETLARAPAAGEVTVITAPSLAEAAETGGSPGHTGATGLPEVTRLRGGEGTEEEV